MSIQNVNASGLLPLNLPQSAQPKSQSTGFDALIDSLQGMSDRQNGANNMMQDVLAGNTDNAHNALIALEKSNMEMQLAVTVRDKLLSGYQQIINMQI